MTQARLLEEPVVALQGPRTVGKSTLLAEIAAANGVRVLDLDDLATRDAVAADPAPFVAGHELVCIDEYQHVPTVLDAIKAELNRELRPGRFLLTGSTRNDALPTAAQALTGRLHLLSVLPLSQGEIAGTKEIFIDSLLENAAGLTARSARSTTTRSDYVELITAGGFPLAIARNAAARGRWIDDYVRLSLERDVRALSRIRRREQFPRLLRSLASQTGQVLNIATSARATRTDERTADNYTRLLEAVFLLQRLPAWGTTLRARTIARPKLHVVDSGVAARLLRLSSDKLARLDATSMTQFGHLLETFVVGEVLKQVSWLDGIAAVAHWRTHDGGEVDVVVERDDGAIIAIEVKASSRLSGDTFRGLRALRTAMGDAFLAGVALHLGERSYTYDDRLHAMPVDALWTPHASN